MSFLQTCSDGVCSEKESYGLLLQIIINGQTCSLAISDSVYKFTGCENTDKKPSCR